MTEYELVDTFNSTVELMITIFSLYLTITTAYLVAAFFTGAKLSSQQCIVVTVLYFVGAGLFTIAMFFAATRVVYTSNTLNLVASDYPVHFPNWAGIAVITLSILGIFSSLKFMWYIRHTEVE